MHKKATHSQKYEDLYWDIKNNTHPTIDRDELTTNRK